MNRLPGAIHLYFAALILENQITIMCLKQTIVFIFQLIVLITVVIVSFPSFIALNFKASHVKT